MKSVIFVVLWVVVGACGGSDGGSGADAGFSGSGDPHALVACDKSWRDSQPVTACEAACEYYEVEMGPSCASITGHTGGICSKTFTADGMTGCCVLMTNGSGQIVRDFYVCP